MEHYHHISSDSHLLAVYVLFQVPHHVPSSFVVVQNGTLKLMRSPSMLKHKTRILIIYYRGRKHIIRIRDGYHQKIKILLSD